MFGSHEWGHRAMVRRAPQRLEAISHAPYVRLHVLDELDHSMFAPSGRRATEQLVLTQLRTGFLEQPASPQLPPTDISETAVS